MGHVISIDNESEESQSVLTETGNGGLLSTGYLHDKPAVDYLEDGETPVFVLTNRKRGVEIGHDGTTDLIASGPGFRTIAVVTDRRIVVLVGDSSVDTVDGDQCLVVQLVDVEGVSTDLGRRTGSLTLSRVGERSLTVHAGADGLDDVAAYVTAASQAWIHVETTLDDVKRKLVTATTHRNDGEYDAALEAAQEAYHGLNEPRRTVNEFADEWSGSALVARIDRIQTRCVEALTEVRLGRARRFTDDGESRWREGEFEAAHDAYDDALAEYESVLTYDSGSVENRDEVREEANRIESTVGKLQEAPLRRAVEADRAASDADDPTTAAEQWEDALEYYRTAMEIDWGADERRFAGDPDQIQDRLGTVVERLVSARRSAATKAKRAGDWYVGAEQYDVAIDELETARDEYDRAIEIARNSYPTAMDHLSVERDAVVERIERAKAARNGETVGPIATETDDVPEPEYDVEATIGDEGVGEELGGEAWGDERWKDGEQGDGVESGESTTPDDRAMDEVPEIESE